MTRNLIRRLKRMGNRVKLSFRLSVPTLCVTVFSLIAANPGYGQRLTLDNILDTIQQSHPSMHMFDAEIRSSDAAAQGARNWMPPQISAGFWMTPYNSAYWKGDNMGTPGMGQYMISAEQMFPNKKYNEANEAYMKAMSSVETEQKEATLNDLYAEAKKNYYDRLVLQKKESVLNESEQLLQFMLDNAETRYRNGLGKISAYYKVKASLADLQSMRVELQNEITETTIALGTLMNRNPSEYVEIDTVYYLKEYDTSNFDTSRLYAGRSDLKAIDRNIEISALQQEVEQQSLKPQFGIEYSHMLGLGGGPAMFSLMGMMKLPLNWSTKMNRANIESLKWKAEALQREKESMALQYAGLTRQLYDRYTTKKKQRSLLDSATIPALKKNYETMMLAYQQNTEELFELFDAWQALINARMQDLDLLQQILNIQVQLDQLLQQK